MFFGFGVFNGRGPALAMPALARTRPGPAQNNAALAADFAARTYRLAGAPIAEAAALQFSRSTKATARTSTSALPIVEVAANAARFEAGGIVQEPARTNLAPNPLCAGGTTGTFGSGGLMPFPWTITGAAPQSNGFAGAYGSGLADQGMAYGRITLARGSATANSFNVRLGGTPGPAVATGNRVGFYAWVRVIEATGIASATLSINSGAVSSTPINLSLLNVWQLLFVARAAGAANARLDINVGLPDTSAAFTLTVDIGAHQAEDLGAGAEAAVLADMTSLTSDPSLSRTAEQIRLMVPDGDYDRLIYPDGGPGAWTDDLAVNGGDLVSVPFGKRVIRSAGYYPAGLSWLAKELRAERARPKAFDAYSPSSLTMNGITYGKQSAGLPHSIQLANNRLNTVRFETRPGDFDAGIGDTAEMNKCRAELASQMTVARGATYWFGQQLIQYTAPLLAEADDVFHLGQMHTVPRAADTQDVSWLTFDYTMDDGVPAIVFRVRSYDYTGLGAAPPIDDPDRVIVTEAARLPIDLGRAYSFVFQVRQDPTGTTGLFNAWADGAQIAAYSGPLGYDQGANADQCYWKCGAYHTDRGEMHRGVWANLEAGTADLSARITNPLPIV